MVSFPERPLFQRSGWKQLAIDWIVAAIVVSAIVAGILLGAQVYLWALHNLEVTLLLALYVLGPLTLLYLAVRIARFAWTGK